MVIFSVITTLSQFHHGPLPVDVLKIKYAESRRLWSSNSDIFVSYKEIIVAKDLDHKVNALHLEESNVNILKSHSSPVTYIATSKRHDVICTCCEKAVYLWKKDTYLKEWSRKKVGKNLGKILACAVFVTDTEIFICLSKSDEIIIIRCLSRVLLNCRDKKLDLAEIDVYATIDKIQQPNIWIGCLFRHEKLSVIGMAQRSGTSVRLWEISNHKESIKGKLLDHKTVPQIKSIAAADLMIGLDNDDYEDADVYLMVLGQEGQVEIFLVLTTGFWLINRLKVDDTVDSSIIAPTMNPSFFKIEFRLLTGRFITKPKFIKADKQNNNFAMNSDEGYTDSEDNEQIFLQNHNNHNSLLTAANQQNERYSPCPQLLAIIATTRKIILMNLRSGEIELSIKYQDLAAEEGGTLLVNNMTLTFDENSSEIVGAMQLLMDKNIYILRSAITFLEEETSSSSAVPPNVSFLISSDKYNTKSALRKKLKSPRSKSTSSSKSTKTTTSLFSFRRTTSTTTFMPKWASGSVSANSFRCPSSSSSSNIVNNNNSNRGGSQSTLFFSKQHNLPAPPLSSRPPKIPVNVTTSGRPGWVTRLGTGDNNNNHNTVSQTMIVSQAPTKSSSLLTPRGSSSISVPLSSRSVKITVSSSYVNKGNEDDLRFDSSQSMQLPIHISDSGISSVRIGSSFDGKVMAMGANCCPFVVFKTQPTFETLRLYKDIGRVSSIHFAFNAKHVLIADNDCKTTLMDWQNNKELLNFKFTSKFNELVSSQFYFMDRFIVQPEENRLVFYSYAIRENTGSISLKAGSFLSPCQSITAMAAANQFYSNYIICGLSSKSLHVFDANAEKVVFNIHQCHNRPITCIRLNEAPKSSYATALCDFVLTSSPNSVDPIKLWDLRTKKCVTRIGDVNVNAFVPTARPSLSPCGRYIATGFEDNSVIVYDIRKINSRVYNLKGMRTSVLDLTFDPTFPMIWCGNRDGTCWNFYAK